MATETSIKQAAIARLGSEVPAALTEDVDELVATNAIYTTLVEEFLTMGLGWSFAKRRADLAVTGATPPEPWLGVFTLPTGVLAVRELRDSCGAPVDYEVEGLNLYANTTDTLSVEYIWRASEERWPGDFAGAVEEELLGRLLEAFEERNAGMQRRQAAAVKLARASRRDRRQNPPKRVSTSPLLRAWYGRSTVRQ